jgi:hypothetical protein
LSHKRLEHRIVGEYDEIELLGVGLEAGPSEMGFLVLVLGGLRSTVYTRMRPFSLESLTFLLSLSNTNLPAFTLNYILFYNRSYTGAGISPAQVETGSGRIGSVRSEGGSSLVCCWISCSLLEN